MTLAREGYREILISTATLGAGAAAAIWASVAVSPWWLLLAIPLSGAWGLSVAFFRDPNRDIPGGPGILVSPADGTVTDVSRLDQYEGFDVPVLRVSIFLSIFNVHINRSPCDAQVTRTDHRPGQFLDARHRECAARNEAMNVWLQPEAGVPTPLLVRQVAGKVARRIICRIGAGDRVQRGERFGLIKFGSRTEVILPYVPGLEARVSVGDHVKGGSTVLLTVGSIDSRSRRDSGAASQVTVGS